MVALNSGLYDVVKASLAGSIIGNILLVLGAAMLAGGVNKGMLKLTFPDGTHAIFKPASGEVGKKAKD